MAAIYAAGLIPCAGMTAAHILIFKRRVHAPAARLLQANLAKIHLYWSESEGNIKSLTTPTDVESDYRSYVRSALLVGGISLLFSWFGLFFQILTVVSLRRLAVSRLEKALFASELRQMELSPSNVEGQVSKLETQLNLKFPRAPQGPIDPLNASV